MKKAIFVGGPDSAKFVNNYAQNMRERGVDVSAHWLDPMRKRFVPAGIDMIIVNADATTTQARDHVRSMCESERVPLVVGCNSVSRTWEQITAMGLMPTDKPVDNSLSDPGPQAIDAARVEYVRVDADGHVHARIRDRNDDVELFVSNGKISTHGQRRASPSDVHGQWPGIEVRYPKAPQQQQQQQEIIVKDEIREISKVVISEEGDVSVSMTAISAKNNRIMTRSVCPVMWGDQFFTSITSVGDVNGVPAGNLHTYIRSGNPYHGRRLRLATVEEILANAAKDVEFIDKRPASMYVVETDKRTKRSFIRVNSGRQNRLLSCPDGRVRMRKDLDVPSIRSVDGQADRGENGWRNPSREEIAKAWPTAKFVEFESSVGDDDEQEMPAPVAVAEPMPLTGEVRLVDILPRGGGQNFMALVVSDTQVILVATSDAARAAFGAEARVLGSRRDVSSMLQGVQWVRL
jgi:hypothetical protein